MTKLMINNITQYNTAWKIDVNLFKNNIAKTVAMFLLVCLKIK